MGRRWVLVSVAATCVLVSSITGACSSDPRRSAPEEGAASTTPPDVDLPYETLLTTADLTDTVGSAWTETSEPTHLGTTEGMYDFDGSDCTAEEQTITLDDSIGSALTGPTEVTYVSQGIYAFQSSEQADAYATYQGVSLPENLAACYADGFNGGNLNIAGPYYLSEPVADLGDQAYFTSEVSDFGPGYETETRERTAHMYIVAQDATVIRLAYELPDGTDPESAGRTLVERILDRI